MSITKLISDIPTVANLTLKIKELEAKIIVLTNENASLTIQLEKANIEIASLKKVPKPPLKMKYNPGYTPDRNMI